METLEKPGTLIYQELLAAMNEQDRLIAEGKIQRPVLKDDVFTPAQEYAYRTGKTFDEILKDYNLL